MHKIHLYGSSFHNYKYWLNNKGLFQIRISIPWETPAFPKVILSQKLLWQSPEPREEHSVWWDLKSRNANPRAGQGCKDWWTPFPDPCTKSILMDCVHKENGNSDFTGGSFHFKSTCWHYLTLTVTSEPNGQGGTGQCSLGIVQIQTDVCFASWFCALDWKGFGSRGDTAWLLGEAARSLTHVQWSQQQRFQHEHCWPRLSTSGPVAAPLG